MMYFQLTATRSPGVIFGEFIIDLIVFDNSIGASEMCVWITSTMVIFPLFLAAISNSLRRRVKGVAPYSSAKRRSKICAYK